MDSFVIMVGSLLVLYVVALLVLGFFLRKRVTDLAGFIVAGRKLPVVLTSISLSASIIGASMTFAAVTKFHSMGLAAIWFSLGPAFFLLVMGLFLADRIRDSRVLTLPELVGKLFDTRNRVVTAGLVLMAEVLWIAVLATATRDVLAGFLGIDPFLALVLSMTVFSLYTIMAGKVADAYTDVVQFVMMVVLVAILVPAVLIRGAGSSVSLDNGDLDIFSGHTPLSLISLFILLGLSYLVGPDVYSSILSAKSRRVARRSAVIAAAIILGWGVLMALLGLGGKLILPDDGGSVMVGLMDASIGWAPLRAVLVAGLIAVLMSSVDTTLLTGSSVFSNDMVGVVLERYPGLSRERRERILYITAKITIVPLAILALLVGVWMRNMMEILYLGYLLFVGGVVLPVVAGLLKRWTRVTNPGAMAGLVLGGGTTLLWYLIYRNGWIDLSFTGPLYELGIVNSSQIVGLGLCLAGMVVVSALTRSRVQR